MAPLCERLARLGREPGLELDMAIWTAALEAAQELHDHVGARQVGFEGLRERVRLGRIELLLRQDAHTILLQVAPHLLALLLEIVRHLRQ
jgi:hypothetical protein